MRTHPNRTIPSRLVGTLPLLIAILIATIVGCRTLSSDPERHENRALPPAKEGSLSETSIAFAKAAGSGATGFEVVERGVDGLAWRLRLVDEARESVDCQYFIFGGVAGDQLTARLLAATGITSHDVVQVGFGYNLFTGGFGFHQGAERIGASVIPSSAGSPERQIDIMRR